MILLKFSHVGIWFPRLTISIYYSFHLHFTFLLRRSSVYYWCTVDFSVLKSCFLCTPLHNMAESTQDIVSGPSSAASVESSGPPLVTPDALIISSAVRDEISSAMLPMKDSLQLLSSTLTQLTSKLYPPSHFSGPGSSSIDVLTPPSAFTRLGVPSASPRAPPSHSYELGASLVRPSHFGLRTTSSAVPVTTLAASSLPSQGPLVPPSQFGLGTVAGLPLPASTDFHVVQPRSEVDSVAESDVLSLHAGSDAEDELRTSSVLPPGGPAGGVSSIFTAFSEGITVKPEDTSAALPSDMAACSTPTWLVWILSRP